MFEARPSVNGLCTQSVLNNSVLTQDLNVPKCGIFAPNLKNKCIFSVTLKITLAVHLNLSSFTPIHKCLVTSSNLAGKSREEFCVIIVNAVKEIHAHRDSMVVDSFYGNSSLKHHMLEGPEMLSHGSTRT